MSGGSRPEEPRATPEFRFGSAEIRMWAGPERPHKSAVGQASVPVTERPRIRQVAKNGAAQRMFSWRPCMNIEEPKLTRRRLPHLRAFGATYFVTWRLAHGQPDLTHAERAIVAAAIRHFDGTRYALAAFVVMNDHVHVVVHPH